MAQGRSFSPAAARQPPAHPSGRSPARPCEPAPSPARSRARGARTWLLSRPPTPSVGGGLPSSLRSSPGQPGAQGSRPSAPARALPLRCAPFQAPHLRRRSRASQALSDKALYPTCPCPAPSSGSASLRLDITSYVNLGWAPLCQCEGLQPSRVSARLRASCHARCLVASRAPAARPPPWQGGSPRVAGLRPATGRARRWRGGYAAAPAAVRATKGERLSNRKRLTNPCSHSPPARHPVRL